MTTNANNRISLHRRVSRDTMRLLRALEKQLKLSQGEVLDRAVAALAVAESFGAEHLKLTPTMKVCADSGGGHSFDRDGFCNYCGNTREQVTLGTEHLRLRGTMPADTAKLYEVKRATQPDYPATHLDATGIDRDSVRGKATLEVVQPLRRAHEQTTRNMRRAINQPPKFEHPNATTVNDE